VKRLEGGLHKILSKKRFACVFFEKRMQWTVDSGSFFEFVFFEERMGGGLGAELRGWIMDHFFMVAAGAVQWS
jgi:hypothetical protein